ncbi:hypothetical protein QVD17_20924 [Tagetes erecta]|uniref:Uncharacterized protein n=1 Tax=Tagetes erecta TaxID=13708 RepID=A0AAD8KM34_TARER|nr:hypothetical protein QVD17_20924 [Tagetes erecta]
MFVLDHEKLRDRVKRDDRLCGFEKIYKRRMGIKGTWGSEKRKKKLLFNCPKKTQPQAAIPVPLSISNVTVLGRRRGPSGNCFNHLPTGLNPRLVPCGV